MKNSGSKRIAERYVRALFDVASSASALNAVEKDMAVLAHTLEQSEDFRDFLTNPLLSREVQAKAMLALLNKLHVHQLTQQFIGLLVAQKRLPVLPDIAAMFLEWAQAARGEMSAELVSAAPLGDKEVALAAERLGKAYGRKMNLDVRQDTSLLGGVIVKIGSVQLDSSLAGKLNRLAVTLKAA